MDVGWDPNAQVVCPYDKLHVISVKRYQHHIVKCRKNHTHKDFVPCPFNAKHLMLRPELKTHIAHCPDRVVLEHGIMKDQCPETGEALRLKGRTDIPTGNCNIPDANADEDWDDEIELNLEKRFEEQTNECRRNYEETGVRLRRPNTLASDNNSNTHHIHARCPAACSDRDDTSSLCSQSSSASSLYVEPVSWNSTQWKQAANKRLDGGNLQHQAGGNINENTLTVTSNQTRTLPVGRGSALSSSIIANNSALGVSSVNSDRVRRPFGRGSLIQTVNKYHTSIR